jgi:cytochrome c peroxidase
MRQFLLLSIVFALITGCGSGGESAPVASDSNESNTSPQTMSGEELFLAHCAECHNEDATGGAGPNIVGSRAQDIEWAVENEAAMRHLQGIIGEVEQTLIAEFLQALKEEQQNGPTSEEQKINLGRALFFDANLSLRRTMSCSTCHDVNRAFIDARYLEPDTSNPVQGALSVGDDGVTLGGRNAPTASYAQFAPDFASLPSGSYIGGLFHDGRALDLKAQAKGPLLDPAEMMMPDAAAVVDRVLENSEYVTQFKALYGETVFDETVNAYDAIAKSIAAFEKTETFAPFDSKYDRSKLDPADPDHYEMSLLEQQGYALFFDLNRTGCALCHTLNSESEAPRELFTNYGFRNIGTPKNIEALLARDGHTDTVDYGLGGRPDISDSAHFGKFKVPTLRNIAVTGPYMHNGVYKELHTVINFYEHMSGNGGDPINPESGEAWADPEINATISRGALQQLQPLEEGDVEALVAFLKLLTDRRFELLLEE